MGQHVPDQVHAILDQLLQITRAIVAAFCVKAYQALEWGAGTANIVVKVHEIDKGPVEGGKTPLLVDETDADRQMIDKILEQMSCRLGFCLQVDCLGKLLFQETF